MYGVYKHRYVICVFNRLQLFSKSGSLTRKKERERKVEKECFFSLQRYVQELPVIGELQLGDETGNSNNQKQKKKPLRYLN